MLEILKAYIDKLEPQEKIKTIDFLLGQEIVDLQNLKKINALLEIIKDYEIRIIKLEKTLNLLQIVFPLGFFFSFLEIGHIAGWI